MKGRVLHERKLIVEMDGTEYNPEAAVELLKKEFDLRNAEVEVLEAEVTIVQDEESGSTKIIYPVLVREEDPLLIAKKRMKQKLKEKPKEEKRKEEKKEEEGKGK